MGKTLSEKVYSSVIDSIIKGEYNQDTVLTESGLINELGYSRSPIREALVTLCNEDILYCIPRYGYKLKISDQKYFNEIIQFRRIIEPAYLDKYFDSITEKDIALIEDKIVTMDKDKFKNPSEYWKRTSSFHLELAYSYRDQYFYEILKQIIDKQWITFSMLYWNNWSSVVDGKLINNHAAILDFIKEGKKDDAINMLVKDINSF